MGNSALKVLVVTSHVVSGHVGGRIAVPVLQALGCEAWHLPTVLFSNHPAHGGFSGRPVEPALIAELLAGLEARDLRPDAVLSGYMGTPETAEALADHLERLGDGVPYCCDPVLGDDGRRYVADGLEEVFRDRLLPRADLATPNRWELEWLTGRPLGDAEAILAAAGELGGEAVCTSALDDGARLTMLARAGEAAFALDVRHLDDVPHGTGDLFSAALLARRLATGDLATALGEAAAIVDLVLRRGRPGQWELALVESLADLVAGVPTLPVRRL